MKVRTVLYPIDNRHDVLVMQYFNQEDSWVTIPMVSSAELSASELNELARTIAQNEKTGQQYVQARSELFNKLNEPVSNVVEVKATDVTEEVVEQPTVGE